MDIAGINQINQWVGAGVIALGSILWAEIVRDLRHWLAHVWPWLMPKHTLHHRLFRRDLSVVDEQLYRESQWHHDVPEAVTMMVAGIPWVILLGWGSWLNGVAATAGIVYSASFWISGMLRGWGLALETDITHQPGPFPVPPSQWHVNRTYHWRHHFDDTNAYFCGTLTFVDRIMGTSLSLKGKRVAVTGASGTLGRALLKHLHRQGAKVIALSSQADPIQIEVNGQPQAVETLQWQVGQEGSLAELLERVDILVLNHGVNVHGARDAAAIQQSYAVNTFSSWRLMELFFQTVRSNPEVATKEVWVNTSEAEVSPAFSPLYELSKRALGDLVTLRRLDAPCVVRKLILGPFKSNLNPIGVMSGDWVAAQILAQAKRDCRNIIVTINPFTYLFLPLKELAVGTYFRLFSHSLPHPEAPASNSDSSGVPQGDSTSVPQGDGILG
ncbi:bifunctional sterol desaturase/short chain dehydrogenase [Thermostichus vulcanus]|uniref:Bifunctional sterol desaturase/short chain dehydrogenase n=1 Tax=Thermostichus vulcanus str. 'Rupite' TaxID=2813851 RepID=A0ABT0C8M6_THEVL|nr:bifunctional sterol desaturase/short chain dehydrogenase [Thermostichus vulcanus]MCJ2542143.1 bifunctional sterol desaturase/short chain dehydrogenase [Thermostichus vulcanus str. 'Rupite']